jgi:hypothetical protein
MRAHSQFIFEENLSLPYLPHSFVEIGVEETGGIFPLYIM